MSTQLPEGGSVETYFEPGGVGVNQWHLIFDGTAAQVASTDPLVTAAPVGEPLQTLRRLTVSPGHFSAVVVLTPGDWRFHVTTRFGTRTVSFTVRHTVS